MVDVDAIALSGAIYGAINIVAAFELRRNAVAHNGLSLYHNCDSTTIRLRRDYDEKLTCSFFARVESRRMEADARDAS